MMITFIFTFLAVGLGCFTMTNGSIGAGIATGLLGIAVAILEKDEVE